MNGLSLVTGANGHLGNNVVRALLQRGMRVRAGVRRLEEDGPFEGLACERVPAPLEDPDALRRALQGVDVFFQVAAVFRHWARDPEREIVQANVEGTRRALHAAADAGVKRVVYVSSVAAVGHDGTPLDETRWNDERHNAYYRSKIESERVAWEVAAERGLPLVVVLPSTMVGPHATRLTDSMAFLDALQRRALPFDPDFHFNFVDVRDVAKAMIEAALRGRPGERYILANRRPSSMADLVAALNAVDPGHRTPPRVPRAVLLGVAWMQERWARLTGLPASLLVSQVRLFHGVRQRYDITKAQAELGFDPRPPEEALREAFRALKGRAVQALAPA
ncbi:MAG TPA: NAD-dependent epimerase/dehydratase family protein [Burkholderiaceae bacterium]|nr:NAD-dependent epimerase/dehydratase family protein [Burkholderiaceae bacterium]